MGVQHIQIQIGQFACALKTSGQASCDFEKGTSVLRELCGQDKAQQPHKKLDQVRFRGVETSDGSLDNVKKTKTTNTRPDLDARIERFNVESEHDVVLSILCCLSPTNDGSVGTNDMPAALDHKLEVRTQKNTSCSKTEITVIADGPAGDWLLVHLCEDAKGRCNCAFAVGK